MVAGEAGADYVLFGSLDLVPPGAVTDLVLWWRELFVLPCAAAGRLSPETARALAAAAPISSPPGRPMSSWPKRFVTDGSS